MSQEELHQEDEVNQLPSSNADLENIPLNDHQTEVVEKLGRAPKRLFSAILYASEYEEINKLFATSLKNNPSLHAKRIEFYKKHGIKEKDYAYYSRSFQMRRQMFEKEQEHKQYNAVDSSESFADILFPSFTEPAAQLSNLTEEQNILEEDLENIELYILLRSQESKPLKQEKKLHKSRWKRIGALASRAVVTTTMIASIGGYAALQTNAGKMIWSGIQSYLNLERSNAKVIIDESSVNDLFRSSRYDTLPISYEQELLQIESDIRQELQREAENQLINIESPTINSASLVPMETETPDETAISISTLAPNETELSTDVPTKTPTEAPTSTFTPIPTETELPTDVPTETPIDTATFVPTETPTSTPTPVPTETASPTDVLAETPTLDPTEIEPPTEIPTEIFLDTINLENTPVSNSFAGTQEVSTLSTDISQDEVLDTRQEELEQSEQNQLIDGRGNIIEYKSTSTTFGFTYNAFADALYGHNGIKPILQAQLNRGEITQEEYKQHMNELDNVMDMFQDGKLTFDIALNDRTGEQSRAYHPENEFAGNADGIFRVEINEDGRVNIIILPRDGRVQMTVPSGAGSYTLGNHRQPFFTFGNHVQSAERNEDGSYRTGLYDGPEGSSFRALMTNVTGEASDVNLLTTLGSFNNLLDFIIPHEGITLDFGSETTIIHHENSFYSQYGPGEQILSPEEFSILLRQRHPDSAQRGKFAIDILSKPENLGAVLSLIENTDNGIARLFREIGIVVQEEEGTQDRRYVTQGNELFFQILATIMNSNVDGDYQVSRDFSTMFVTELLKTNGVINVPMMLSGNPQDYANYIQTQTLTVEDMYELLNDRNNIVVPTFVLDRYKMETQDTPFEVTSIWDITSYYNNVNTSTFDYEDIIERILKDTGIDVSRSIPTGLAYLKEVDRFIVFKDSQAAQRLTEA